MIFVFDVDGTICFNGKFIEPRLNKVIKSLNEKHEIIFASARPIRDLLPVVSEFKNNTLIGGNGSIVSLNGNIQVIDYIPIPLFENIKRIISEYNLSFIIDGMFDYAANVNSNHPIFKQLDPDHLASNVEISKIQRPIKIILLNIENSAYEAIVAQFNDFEDELSINLHELEGNIDITAKNINKYTTLKNIIGNQNYIAFGNDINDVQLLDYAQKSFYVTGHTDCQLSYDTLIENDAKSVASVIEAMYL
ncbi:HAD hydrolase family protein [Staphylococcus caeli]|uniref:HAD hydrolase family protein n=1 Tax=Staphylococcus caeli TaxID=2201815 RepID=UPI003F56AC83